MDIPYWLTLANKSGGVLFLMPILLLAVLTVAFERSWVLGRLTRYGARLIAGLSCAPHGARQAMTEIAGDAPPSPQREVLAAMLGSGDAEGAAALAEEAMLHAAPRLDRGLWVLDTAVTIAPLLGLLGTIIGMFHAFQLLAPGAGDPTAVTGHVAEALVATAAGLTIAIIGLFFFNALNQRVRLILHQMETVKAVAINRLYPRTAAPPNRKALPMPLRAEG